MTKLTEAWRKRTAALRDRLTADQLEALRRARMGYPPAVLLGWPTDASSYRPALRMVESIAGSLAELEDLLDRDQWVDFRQEVDALRVFAAELQEALAASRIENAVLRAMAIGAMFTRLAYLLLDGDAIAVGGAVNRGRDKTLPRIKATKDDERVPRDRELERLIEADRRKSSDNEKMTDRAVAGRLLPLFETWAESEERDPPSERTIRRWLKDRKTKLAKLAQAGQ